MKKKSLKISPVAGRPVLQWVGKKPLDKVSYYPAQLCETVNVSSDVSNELNYHQFIDGNSNLLIHGDNREILSSLITVGFRGMIDLIYIDPPFASGVNYARKISIRSITKRTVINQKNADDAKHPVIEQAQYDDIWANDNYLQFMYERLILMRELLTEKGSIYLHCDWHKSHHLRFLLDEIFGENNFVNEITWVYHGASAPGQRHFSRKHDTIFWYRKGESVIFNSDDVRIPYHETTAGKFKSKGTGFIGGAKADLSKGKLPEDWWEIPEDWWKMAITARKRNEILDFPTQKPESLVERIIKASSNKDSIVLDCFCGSGTTAAVAERLGRRWIMADLNKGAIQTTIGRVLNVSNSKKKVKRGILHYRINNYDHARQDELKRIIIRKYGIQINRMDPFFDGLCGGRLAKIIDLNRPLTKLDIKIIRDEIANSRSNETRDIIVFCNGSELNVVNKSERNRNPINKISVCDIQQEGVFTYMPPEASVSIVKDDKKASIEISDYVSPSILTRMNIDRTIFNERITDFRAQIDSVSIDNDYDGKVFNRVEVDHPKMRQGFITGSYVVTLPSSNSKVAVKIVDMLGEETIVVK